MIYRNRVTRKVINILCKASYSVLFSKEHYHLFLHARNCSRDGQG